MAIPIFVHGTNESGSPFKENTETIVINARGALIELQTPVAKEQELRLTNMETRAEITCHVVTFRRSESGKAQIGIRFNEASPRFWGLGFPPEDWDPAERKLPDSQRR